MNFIGQTLNKGFNYISNNPVKSILAVIPIGSILYGSFSPLNVTIVKSSEKPCEPKVYPPLMTAIGIMTLPFLRSWLDLLFAVAYLPFVALSDIWLFSTDCVLYPGNYIKYKRYLSEWEKEHPPQRMM